MGHVTAVHASPTHHFSKETAQQITLIEGLGVEGDAHSGVTVKHRSRWQNKSLPNLRQVHLIHDELFDHLRTVGHNVEPGQLGENITTHGIDLLGLPVGARLTIGDHSVVIVTGLRNPCVQIDRFQPGLLKEVLLTADDGKPVRLAGVMGIVARGGVVRGGDEISVELPPEPHYPLERV